MLFGTQEWADAFCKAINGNENYRDAAGPEGFPPDGWEGDFLFVVEPSGNLDHELRMFVGLYHGECTGCQVLKEGEEKDGLKRTFASYIRIFLLAFQKHPYYSPGGPLCPPGLVSGTGQSDGSARYHRN